MKSPPREVKTLTSSKTRANNAPIPTSCTDGASSLARVLSRKTPRPPTNPGRGCGRGRVAIWGCPCITSWCRWESRRKNHELRRSWECTGLIWISWPVSQRWRLSQWGGKNWPLDRSWPNLAIKSRWKVWKRTYFSSLKNWLKWRGKRELNPILNLLSKSKRRTCLNGRKARNCSWTIQTLISRWANNAQHFQEFPDFS